MQHQHLLVRPRNPWRRFQTATNAHSTEGSGIEPVPRCEGRDRLASVVQDLLPVDDQDRVTSREVAHLLA